MYQPMVLEQLVAQHVNELHADAAEQRLARQCRDGHTQRPAGHLGRHLRRSILRLWLTVARQVRRWPRLDQPTVLEAEAGADEMQVACEEFDQTPQDAVALAAVTGADG